jgi:hypothetical protein
MTITQSVKRYGTRRLMRRVSRSLPWIGGVIAIVTLGGAIKRKGLLGGLVHTALDAIPYVGAAKNLFEAGRGRDLILDKSARIRADAATSSASPYGSSAGQSDRRRQDTYPSL